jgi:hypothetical protein
VEPTVTETPVEITVTPTETPTPAPPFSCPTGTYSLLTADGETTGCVAITNNYWAINATTGLQYDALYVTFTAAPDTCLTGARIAVSLSSDPIAPQYSEVFDPAACTTTHTFSVELPSYYDDVPELFVSAFGTVRQVKGEAASADLEVSVLENPIDYYISYLQF